MPDLEVSHSCKLVVFNRTSCVLFACCFCGPLIFSLFNIIYLFVYYLFINIILRE